MRRLKYWILIGGVLWSSLSLVRCQDDQNRGAEKSQNATETSLELTNSAIPLNEAITMLDNGRYEELWETLRDSVNTGIRDTISTLIFERNLLMKCLSEVDITEHQYKTTGSNPRFIPLEFDCLFYLSNVVNVPDPLQEALQKYEEFLSFMKSDMENINKIMQLRNTYNGPRHMTEIEGQVTGKAPEMEDTYTVRTYSQEIVLQTTISNFTRRGEYIQMQCYHLGTIEVPDEAGFTNRIPLYKEAAGMPSGIKSLLDQMIDRYQEVMAFEDTSRSKGKIAHTYAKELFPEVQSMLIDFKQDGALKDSVFIHQHDEIRKGHLSWEAAFRWRWDFEEFQEDENLSKMLW